MKEVVQPRTEVAVSSPLSTDSTFEELTASKAPTPETIEDLTTYIKTLVDRRHDYNTTVPAISLASVATFNFVASRLGASGFQGGCADMDVLRRTRGMERFMVIDFGNALYPQYDLHAELSQALLNARSWLAERAEQRLAEVDDGFASPAVVAHWRRLVNAERATMDSGPMPGMTS